MGINDALSESVFNESLIPGEMIPPSYFFSIKTSKVVAVPKSRIIKFLSLLKTPNALANLSDPTCLKFTPIVKIDFKFNSFNSKHLIFVFF